MFNFLCPFAYLYKRKITLKLFVKIQLHYEEKSVKNLLHSNVFVGACRDFTFDADLVPGAAQSRASCHRTKRC